MFSVETVLERMFMSVMLVGDRNGGKAQSTAPPPLDREQEKLDGETILRSLRGRRTQRGRINKIKVVTIIIIQNVYLYGYIIIIQNNDYNKMRL